MSQIIDINRPKRPLRREARQVQRSRTARAKSVRAWRTITALLAVELLYSFALALAIPIGRGAVALTIALGFTLALCIAALLGRDDPDATRL